MEANIDKLIRYLSPYKKFINCHMVAYFTEKHYDTFVSTAIRDEINHNLPQVIADLIDKGYDIDGYPALRAFVQDSKSHTLPELKNASMNLQNFQTEVLKMEKSEKGSLKIKEFMSAKKCHEVEVTSKVVHDICKMKENLAIVDAGDGKGYLSSRLALEYQLPVLGIDSSKINTSGATKRSEKLEKAWSMLVSKAKLREAGNEPPRVGRRNRHRRSSKDRDEVASKLYQTVTQFIDHHTDLLALVKEAFPDQLFNTFCLTGLHTCGNLASNCLDIYSRNGSIKILCNIGCCYHLLDEPGGFPLSQHLKKQNFTIGRNARMLASQSANRFFHEKELPHKSLLHRAMLEVILCQKVPDNVRRDFTVGKSKSKDFVEYVENSFKKFNVEGPSREEILQIQEEYEKYWDEMKFFYLFRIFFAPIIESLILLDRLLFLQEQGLTNSYIVHLFDSVISPRCYGIISIKND